MDLYIWNLILWVVVFFIGSPLAGWFVGGLGVFIAAVTNKASIALVFVVLGWITYAVVALVSLFFGIQSIIELVQYATQ